MHSALFVASLTTPKTDWATFCQYVDQKLSRDESVVRLSENVWLVNVQQSPAALGHLVHYAEAHKVAYGIVPFERAPEWLPGGFDPKTIQVRSAGSLMNR